MNTELTHTKIRTKTVRVPVVAGMSFDGKITKMQTVGYDVFLQTYEVDHYSDGHKDWVMISSQRIKRVITV